LLYSEKPNAWFAPIRELEAVADELFTKGYLNRAQRDGRTVYQIARAAAVAQQLHVMTAINTTSN
jgi:hypothetical protein